MKEDEETITIPVTRYAYLIERENLLEALEQCDVDDWSGWPEAHDLVEDWEKDKSEDNK